MRSTGVYSWNNMANLLEDVVSGEVDAVVHIGDHAYNMGGMDERRGDAYMQAYEPIISKAPWFPVVGNHGKPSSLQLERDSCS